MTADQIRYSSIESDVLRVSPDIRGAFIADMLQEIAAQLAESNALARLRLRMDLMNCGFIAMMPSEINEELEAMK